MISFRSKKPLYSHSLLEKKRSWKLFVLSILSFSALVYLVIFTAPTASFDVLTIPIPVLPFFFSLLFLFLFSLCTFLFNSRMHGVLIALLAIIYLLFRQNDLTHPFFAVLLLALFLVLELMFTYKK